MLEGREDNPPRARPVVSTCGAWLGGTGWGTRGMRRPLTKSASSSSSTRKPAARRNQEGGLASDKPLQPAHLVIARARFARSSSGVHSRTCRQTGKSASRRGARRTSASALYILIVPVVSAWVDARAWAGGGGGAAPTLARRPLTARLLTEVQPIHVSASADSTDSANSSRNQWETPGSSHGSSKCLQRKG